MLRDVVVSNPEIMSGTPCFKGTRVPLQSLLDYLLGDATVEEFLLDFPTVSRTAVEQVLQSLADSAHDAHPAG
ncbi:DUF433 domain-containing protein [Massilia arenosa]|uniref:DUF433 domain-containing protein n=1 Tax=Zemynaea arenosa TaxID=2561931 RepID=A0A4Y9S6X7_9BURK|nr:DUF433 domain-containing protein [Massilia arenosa]TFW17222.1 DUF433 domain-containing protein [Massilia arenosa]